MKLVEFLVFIARLAHEIFHGTKHDDKPLHIKVDRILGPLLET